ncbi:MAG: hypothetical protein UW46_C0005G0012 [Candidatus Yanofskybacteria bacterium GW2011_GWF1_44_227]|uniref:Uncharacterized protein n=1 Tax=Candidatus Yanofskybacteria bacterium GW2011_GWE2_40_11 TaxID=1619033 RepID=A0A0G0T1J7_9BACT|nr:MAG: hypothetical protein UT69_C0010G0031 [Candidatus Yanofskybacteria bacterium GW2011_GWE1_40_10]KKR40975.1 MAG: hypothetical protein UT75_C0002G0012 [Candidatus Yanofskybacteria bacterium GW2011_GWE2_40_11]KKT15545.1 MAG: hypothetical protein UV97_C0005G0038 [Candidatus Yanofskybacteria bacterium GW2011_GWF2_43_596]KKT53206.1 MAG: hypothetical protein UW46_C0005G0012 [Candidatus Yanofskybacteria bacterium GW2011_GWF1_44_227]
MVPHRGPNGYSIDDHEAVIYRAYMLTILLLLVKLDFDLYDVTFLNDVVAANCMYLAF